ncbi:MAG: TIGR04282 family arsenosugar biosynthesis glycosyltransferase [Candidatus Binatia bacterium]
MSDRRGALCVFAKPPMPGRVKTRLVPALGVEGAAHLAHAVLCDTWSSARALPWASPILATTHVFPPALRPAPDAVVWMQGSGDLGRRIERILARALGRFPFAIALGADTPGLPVRFLEEARVALGSADAVVGPTEDGGFYLLGLRRCPRGLLAGLPWSDRDTCARTLERLRARGLITVVLDSWFDIDRPEDLDRLRALLGRGELAAPATCRALGRTQA